MAAAKFIDKHFGISKHARTALLHTRMATQGDKAYAVNNHPVCTSGLVGVHNGMVCNDYAIFSDLSPKVHRIGRVDSEAIFAAIANHHELSLQSEVAALEVIEGSAAVAWMSAEPNDPWLHCARISQSPFVWAQTPLGSFVFASELAALRSAMEDTGLTVDVHGSLDEGTYLKVKEGVIHERTFFTPAPSFRPASRQYGTGYSNVDTTRTVRRTSTGQPVTQPYLLTVEDFDPNLTVALATSEQHRSASTLRERAIDDFCNIDEVALLAHDKWWDLMGACHAHARVGSVVWTEFGGEMVPGQLVRLPSTFPHGEYMLRLTVSNDAREEGVEVVFVSRRSDEFITEDNYVPAETTKEVALANA